MANLNSRSALHKNWTKWALVPLSAFQNCVVALFDPNSSTNGDSYDPYANNATSAPTKLWQGAGQVSIYRQTLTVDDVAGSVAHIRSIRFEVAKDGPSMPIRKGMLLRVIDSPIDAQLESYEFIVTSGIDGALSWLRTIEAESDMSVVAPPISEVTP